jgi:glycerophosphoryl diester phosphodiesterase
VDLRQHFGLNAPLIFLTAASGAPYDLASIGDPTTYADLTTAVGLRSISGVGNDATAYGRAIDEQVQYLQTGIDGFFTDQCDIGVIARAEFLAAKAAA